MPNASSSRPTKRKKAGDVVVLQPPSKVTFLSPSLFLLEIPAEANTSLPVWEAMRSQQLDIAWTVNPYSIAVRLTPVTLKQGGGPYGPCSPRWSSSPSAASPPRAPASCSPSPRAAPDCCPARRRPPPSSSPCPSSSPNRSPRVSPAPPTKRRALSPKGPVPSPFHTKSSPDVQVCDRFLLGLCRAGQQCQRHHTPYPFHWQLWSMSSHQWVDLPSRSQVLLERSYCNVKQESVFIKEGKLRCSLVFDSMEINDSAEYYEYRRLTNSDSLVKNPYFPSRWKIYWWNNVDWEEYNQVVSASLLQRMSLKEPECSFHVDSQEYEVDFTTMIQTHVATGLCRNVRCRPFYRSPDSMRPHLQTGILTEPFGDPPPGANFSVDPLEEFSSWYPPVWSLDLEQDYSLVDLPAGTQAYRSVQGLFYESLPETRVDIIGIQQVQNLLHWDKYQRHKAYMQKRHAESRGPLERHLFHGTTKGASMDICHNNFDPRMVGVNGTSYGFGSYFAPSASFSNSYSAKSRPDGVRYMFLAKVLVGRVSLGSADYRRPPPIDSGKSRFLLHDACVDNVEDPSMFVVFDSCQCYPYYLITYKDLPTSIDIR